MQTFSEQTRCQNQIPDDARTGQDELNLSGSNWTCPNVLPAKCKEINQGSAPSAPSHHHIVFNLQKPCVESDVKALEAREWKACFVSRRSKVLRLPSYGWSGFNTLLNSLLWCIVGCLMHRWGKKSTQKTVGKIWGHGYGQTYICWAGFWWSFLLVVSTNLEVQTIKKLKYFLKYKDASVDQVSAQRSILFTPAWIITSLIFLNEYSLNDYFELNFATTVAPRMGRVESGRKL